MSASEFGTATGIPVSTLKKYESNHSTPGGEAIQSIAGVGINVHWLVTGEGPMLLADLQPSEPTAWNPDLMRQVIEAVEEALERGNRELEPEDKASLILSVYDLYADAGAQPDRSKIIRFVLSAA